MPRSRATERSERAAPPSSARCRRATSRISVVSSCRTLARAVREADGRRGTDGTGGGPGIRASVTALPRVHKYLTRTMFLFKINVRKLVNRAPNTRRIEEATIVTNPNTEAPNSASTSPPHYKRPDWVTRNVMNRLMIGLTRLGVSVRGSRVLEHRGRTSGELHHVPVNLLSIDGTQYLVAPRGETQWVRNVRHADGHLVLILGRRRQLCTAVEVPAAQRTPILPRLPAQVEVRDGHVLRRRHARLDRRGVGIGGGAPSGLRDPLIGHGADCS